MDLIKYSFGTSEVRTVLIDGEPWFVAMDVARILGYADTEKMTRRLDGDEMQKVKPPVLGDLVNWRGGNDMTIISESGIYNAIMGSSKPEAKSFKRWVTSEVLPSIRKTGQYRSIAKSLPQTYGELVVEYGKSLVEGDRKQALLEEQKPMVESYHSLISACGNLSMGEAAKTITEATEYYIGRNILLRILRYKAVLDEHNIPYQKFVNSGYFHVVATNPNGIGVIKTTLVTPRGLDYIRLLIVNMGEGEMAKAAGSPAVLKAITKMAAYSN